MNEILQAIGSVASILGVPLAVYLFLKGQVQKYADVRREIVKRLSHQIGEGRKVGLFELNAVIDSLVRENRLRRGSISSSSIIEDLVAETISSPLLDSAKKEQLIAELTEVHSLGKMYQTIASDDEAFQSFIEYLGAKSGSNDEADELRKEVENAKEKSQEGSKLPELFGGISAAIAGMAAAASIASFFEGTQLLPRILDSEILTSLLLGVGASVAAAGIAVLISKRTSDQ